MNSHEPGQFVSLVVKDVSLMILIFFFFFGGGGRGDTFHGGIPQTKQNGTCKNALIALVGMDRIEKTPPTKKRYKKGRSKNPFV